MTETGRERTASRPAGYAALVERYGVDVIPNWHASRVASRGVRRLASRDGVVEEIFPSRYWPGDAPGDQLAFALKHDGTNLAILATLFREMPADDLLAYVRSRPTGNYARRLWFLYELLTDRKLPLDDVRQGNYVDLLDPEAYYTVASPRRARRQRVNDNLLGDHRFCPTVRRTGVLRDFEAADLPARCRRIASRYAPGLLKRALGYLYARETKSSFEIERVTPGSTRTERFVARGPAPALRARRAGPGAGPYPDLEGEPRALHQPHRLVDERRVLLNPIQDTLEVHPVLLPRRLAAATPIVADSGTGCVSDVEAPFCPSGRGRRLPMRALGALVLVRQEPVRACAEPASRPSAPRSGGGAERRALTPVSNTRTMGV